MKISISIDFYVNIHTKSALTKEESQILSSQLEKDIKAYIELRISDLAIKHKKLLDGYLADIWQIRIRINPIIMTIYQRLALEKAWKKYKNDHGGFPKHDYPHFMATLAKINFHRTYIWPQIIWWNI